MAPNHFIFGPDIVQSPERAVALEWLETNGLGDFACGTAAGPATRRQHGLFVAGNPDGGDMLLLAAMDVALERETERFELSCHQYADALYPEGYRFCRRFAAAPVPEWRYDVPGAQLTARVCMPHDRRCTVCTWALAEGPSGGPWRLRVRPLFAYRPVDALTRANADVNMSWQQDGDALAVAPYPGCPRMLLHAAGADVRAAQDWYYRFHHPRDAAFGREGDEDLFSICEFAFEMTPGRTVALVAGLDESPIDAAHIIEDESGRRRRLTLAGIEDDPFANALAKAADAYIIRRAADDTDVRVSMPFGAGGIRSKLIAFPGLLLSTRRLEQAKEFIEQAVRDAPAGNVLDDTPLWLVRAGEQYVDHSRDWGFLRETLAPACAEIVQSYLDNAGAAGYRMAPDALLCSSDIGSALTWMDATNAGRPVTPRTGKPVEVNALWHHALSLIARWSRRGDDAGQTERFAHLRDLCGRSFRHRFWDPIERCLHDTVDSPGGGDPPQDGRFRPNQIIAVALPSDLLQREQAKAVLAFVERRLLTPFGLRSLSLEDRAFRPCYRGGKIDRAAARHQGSVHPWLMGAYVDAVFRVHGRTSRATARAGSALEPLLAEHLAQGCVGHVAELFNGAAPHQPAGAFAHAPAVGELCRAYVEVNGRLW